MRPSTSQATARRRRDQQTYRPPSNKPAYPLCRPQRFPQRFRCRTGVGRQANSKLKFHHEFDPGRRRMANDVRATAPCRGRTCVGRFDYLFEPLDVGESDGDGQEADVGPIAVCVALATPATAAPTAAVLLATTRSAQLEFAPSGATPQSAAVADYFAGLFDRRTATRQFAGTTQACGHANRAIALIVCQRRRSQWRGPNETAESLTKRVLCAPERSKPYPACASSPQCGWCCSISGRGWTCRRPDSGRRWRRSSTAARRVSTCFSSSAASC